MRGALRGRPAAFAGVTPGGRGRGGRVAHGARGGVVAAAAAAAAIVARARDVARDAQREQRAGEHEARERRSGHEGPVPEAEVRGGRGAGRVAEDVSADLTERELDPRVRRVLERVSELAV